MEWLIGAILYSIIGFLFGTGTTKLMYKQALKDNKNPLPKNTPAFKKKNQEQIDKLETDRRKKLAADAMTAGFWVGLLWIIVVPVFVLIFSFGLVFKGFHALAIKPEDKEFISEKEMRKAQAIVDKYNKEQEEKFDKELKG